MILNLDGRILEANDAFLGMLQYGCEDFVADGVHCTNRETTMTCRIDRLANGKGGVVFRVSGRLDAENVDTLRELLGRERVQSLSTSRRSLSRITML
jgi:hypothetical protein